MLSKLIQVSLTLILLGILQFILASKCFNNSIENIHTRLGTKSAYRFVQNADQQLIKFSNCKPIKLWGIVRHGSRNPSKKLIKNINTKLVNMKNKILNSKGNLCVEDLENLRNWEPSYVEEQAKYLVSAGENELINLGERMQSRLPDLFPEYFDNKSYKVS